MNVIITMAGAGSRFKQCGIETEKYRLQIKDRSMFEFAMDSLREFFDQRFVFVARREHDARPFVEEKCATLGIDNYDVVEISELTSGQATTARRAAPEIENDEAIMIYNIDTYVAGRHLSKSVTDGDGCIPVFETDGGSWSYVATDEQGLAMEVAEKDPISNLASLGLYYFDRLSLFESALHTIGNEVEANYGERYIAPLYNWLIDQGYNVTVPRVPRSAVNILGTPADVREFDPEFPSRYGIDD